MNKVLNEEAAQLRDLMNQTMEERNLAQVSLEEVQRELGRTVLENMHVDQAGAQAPIASFQSGTQIVVGSTSRAFETMARA